MRIAYFVNQYPKVTHTFIRREILALEAQGIEVTRISLRGTEAELLDPADIAEFHKTKYVLRAGALEIFTACARALLARPVAFFGALRMAVQVGLKSDRGLLRHFAYFVEACIVQHWLRKRDVRHVHAHFGTNSAAVVMLSRRMGGPGYSFTVHGPEEFDRPGQLALREKVRDATFVAAISSFCRSQVYRWSAVADWSKVHVVRCALEPAYFSSQATPITSAPKLVCVGRLSEEKGQALLVQAAHLLVQRGVELQLTLAGDGPMRAQLQAMIATLGLEQRVHITGWIDNQRVRAHLAESRALVLPSFAEGLPVVIMEAFAMRRPVLSTFVAGIPELVEHQVSGWLVPAGDIERLADAMREVLEASSERLMEMGARGQQRTRERHDVDVEAGKLKQLFAALGA